MCDPPGLFRVAFSTEAKDLWIQRSDPGGPELSKGPWSWAAVGGGVFADCSMGAAAMAGDERPEPGCWQTDRRAAEAWGGGR